MFIHRRSRRHLHDSSRFFHEIMNLSEKSSVEDIRRRVTPVPWTPRRPPQTQGQRFFVVRVGFYTDQPYPDPRPSGSSPKDSHIEVHLWDFETEGLIVYEIRQTSTTRENYHRFDRRPTTKIITTYKTFILEVVIKL